MTHSTGRIRRKQLSPVQRIAIERLADFLTEDFDKRCVLLRAGDRIAIQWHQMRLAYCMVGKMSRTDTLRHLEEFIYR